MLYQYRIVMNEKKSDKSGQKKGIGHDYVKSFSYFCTRKTNNNRIINLKNPKHEKVLYLSYF